MAEMTKAQLIDALQAKGVEVNPSAKVEDLRKQLNASDANVGGVALTTNETVAVVTPTAPASEISELLGAVKTMISKVNQLDQRINRIETKGSEDFKTGAKDEDIEAAKASKEGLNPRLVQIVENTLGIDFKVELLGNKENPGSMMTVLVPERLSPVARAFRPVKGEDGKNQVDPKTGRDIEEEYWPGDRRSVALGAADSYDMVQAHCNRVRSNILAYYQKTNKPQPEFRTR